MLRRVPDAVYSNPFAMYPLANHQLPVCIVTLSAAIRTQHHIVAIGYLSAPLAWPEYRVSFFCRVAVLSLRNRIVLEISNQISFVLFRFVSSFQYSSILPF